MLKVLFVCTGNICRSPTAEGVFAAKVDSAGLGDKIASDSCGTHGYHIGDAPDRRAIAAARTRGYDLSPLRARRLTERDFSTFNLLFAMDDGHERIMRSMAPRGSEDRVKLLLPYAGVPGRDVPDPYYGDDGGFERVLDMIEQASDAIIAKLRREL